MQEDSPAEIPPRSPDELASIADTLRSVHIQAIRERAAALAALATALRDRSRMQPLLDQIVASTGMAISNVWLREFETAAWFLSERVQLLLRRYPPAQLAALQPRGTVGCVLPSNGPLFTMAKVLGAGYLVGNRLIFKLPRVLAGCLPAVRELLRAHLSGVDVTCPSGADANQQFTAEMVARADVSLLVAFGSAGWIDGVRQLTDAAGKTLIFEGPGNDAATVLPEADLERAAAAICQAAFVNGGQSCSAIKRVYVHRDVVRAFADRFLAHVACIKAGSPSNPDVQVTPLLSPALRARAERHLLDAEQQGATLLFGDGRLDRSHLLRPTVLLARQSMQVVVEETFYPAVPVVPFADDDELVSYVEGTRYGLNAAVFGDRRGDLVARFARSHKSVFADTTAVSRAQLAEAALVGGHKTSAFIRENAPGQGGERRTRQGRFALEIELAAAAGATSERCRGGAVQRLGEAAS